ncbi:MAG: hypothetical protein UV01_C0003G0099 [Parcubacteria group bacterium GW2011_GWA2_42_14]|nr:MAG: hypothetical protein UV01_C0003G0099 [Parcubacteria group bacterium GW2011_GWA2_42_14]
MKNVDVVVSFDTTGSMYPCLTQVRRRVNEMIDRLFREIPSLRVGIIAHGDYCDRYSTYVTKTLELTSDRNRLYRFVSDVPATSGGDAPECYELVLHEARSFNWGPDAKTLIVIGDDVPHSPSYPDNKDRLDWKNEIELLLKMGVNVYGVQALNRSHATSFYREIAERTGGFHLTLDQFSNVVELVMAICYQQASSENLSQWEKEVERSGHMSRSLDEAFGILSGRRTPSSRFRKSRDLEAVPTGRFQIMRVDTDQSIRDFVEDNGLTFKKGRGFYQLTKTETIQEYKEIVLRDDHTSDLYSGEKARELLGLPRSGSIRTRPVVPHGYTAFVQSTSYNRKLIGGTEFLYEVDLSR